MLFQESKLQIGSGKFLGVVCLGVLWGKMGLKTGILVGFSEPVVQENDKWGDLRAFLGDLREFYVICVYIIGKDWENGLEGLKMAWSVWRGLLGCVGVLLVVMVGAGGGCYNSQVVWKGSNANLKIGKNLHLAWRKGWLPSPPFLLNVLRISTLELLYFTFPISETISKVKQKYFYNLEQF